MPLPAFVAVNSTHPEAIDWAKRASANGGTISTNALRAVSVFCRAADAGSFRSSLYRCNLFIGGNLSGCLVPLYLGPTFGGTTYGSATDTNANFVSADFIETGSGAGLKGNGTSKYLNTGFSNNSLPSATSGHLSWSAINAETSGSFVGIGSWDGSGTGLMSLETYLAASSGRSFRFGSFSAGQFPSVSTPGATESHIIGSRTSATSSTIYRSGVSAATATAPVTPTRTANAMFVFALNSSGSAAFFTAATLRMYSIGTGLDATQAAAFSAAVAAFNAALGR